MTLPHEATTALGWTWEDLAAYIEAIACLAAVEISLRKCSFLSGRPVATTLVATGKRNQVKNSHGRVDP